MDSSNRLDPDKILARLGQDHFIREIRVEEVAESTNLQLGALAEEDESAARLCLAAETQTAGQGRMGRSWASESYQSLTFSFLCPNFFPAHPGWVTLGTALAAASAIERESAISPRVKWPNDLYLRGRKLGGILAKPMKSPSGKAMMVVGLGLNVNAAPPRSQQDMEAAPICLRELAHAPLDRSLLLAGILNDIHLLLTRFSKGEQEFVVTALRERSLLLNAWAEFEWKNRKYRGKVLDHTLDLGILLATDKEKVKLPGETARLIRYNLGGDHSNGFETDP